MSRGGEAPYDGDSLRESGSRYRVTFESDTPNESSVAASSQAIGLGSEWSFLSEPSPTAAQPAAEVREDAVHLMRLMERYQQGDAQAVTELVKRLSPMLRRFLSGPLQTRTQADDMLQDCWLRLHRARSSYRPGSPVLPWIFAIARHTRIDAYRRRSTIEAREYASDDLETAGSGSVSQPEDSDRDLWRLVAQLPTSQQEVVRMLKVSGLSLEETARATGSSVGAVKQKAHRAYRKLRELIEAHDGAGRR